MYRVRIGLLLVFSLVVFRVYGETHAARLAVPVSNERYVDRVDPTSNSFSQSMAGPKQITSIFLPLVMAGSVQVLCDSKVYDGYTTVPFQLKSTSHQDPTIQKVIRNCVFRNSNLPAVVIKNARNVLIEGSTFENIRTHTPGVGVHAINIPCDSGCTIDNIIIRNNIIRYIGADGIQLGEATNTISHVYIQNNEFLGSEDVGENAIDVKGVLGPIYIGGNTVHGFRPCQSAKTNPPGTQDCTGSAGEGIVLHDGGSPVRTSPINVMLENNYVYDNINGIVVSTGSQNITVQGNHVENNVAIGILANNIYSILVKGNALSYNPTHIKVQFSPLTGGACTLSDNIFVGSGTTLNLQASTCN